MYISYEDNNGGDGVPDQVTAHYDDGTTHSYSLSSAYFPQDVLNEMMKNPVTNSPSSQKPQDPNQAPVVPNEMPPPAKLPADTTSLDNINSPKYDGSGKDGEVTVNTDALRQFSTFLDNLGEPLRTLKAEVDKVAVHPGAFYQAFHLKNAVHTDPALQTNTSKAIAQTLDAFASIKQGITKLTAEYDSAEELNSASAEDLKKMLSSANTIINKMSGTS